MASSSTSHDSSSTEFHNCGRSTHSPMSACSKLLYSNWRRSIQNQITWRLRKLTTSTYSRKHSLNTSHDLKTVLVSSVEPPWPKSLCASTCVSTHLRTMRSTHFRHTPCLLPPWQLRDLMRAIRWASKTMSGRKTVNCYRTTNFELERYSPFINTVFTCMHNLILKNIM